MSDDRWTDTENMVVVRRVGAAESDALPGLDAALTSLVEDPPATVEDFLKRLPS